MPVFNAYQYKPLSAPSAIRLIALRQATDHWTSLTCRIIEEQHPSQHPGYTAVSYAWGEHEFGRNLEVRHNGDVSYLRITPVVDALLRYLRKPDKPCYLWIDAICLDQEDELEKALQIPQMGTIYRTATEVAIWLGPAAPMTARLFDFFRELSEVPDVTQWATQWDMAGCISDLMGKLIDHEPTVSMGAILDFFRLPWFSRRWVIQEACLSRQAFVHCGKQIIPLPVLSQAAERFQRLDMSDYAIEMTANLNGMKTQSTMLELLWHFHEATCTEPKDRIASLLNMVPDDGQRFHLDYGKHWTETFEEFTSFTYTQGDNNVKLQLLLHLFEFGPMSGRTNATFPSWVPDWTQTRSRSLPYLNYPKNTDTYETYPCSPGCSNEKAALTFHSKCLTVHWNASIARSPEYRVTFSTAVDSRHNNCAYSAEQIMERLFQSVPDNAQEIIMFASLLQLVSEFRHPEATRETTSKPLGRFERKLRKHHPYPNIEELLVWLRTLESVLTDFSLVELKSIGQNSDVVRSYGIGPGQMKADDVVIPLWYHRGRWPEPRSLYDAAEYGVRSGIGVHTSVMLAVRRIAKQRSDASDEKELADAARIIGPVITVAQNTDNIPFDDETPDTDDSGGINVKGWSSMRLI